MVRIQIQVRSLECLACFPNTLILRRLLSTLGSSRVKLVRLTARLPEAEADFMEYIVCCFPHSSSSVAIKFGYQIILQGAVNYTDYLILVKNFKFHRL